MIIHPVDSVIHLLNQLRYPLDSAIDSAMTYALDSDLSGGQQYPPFEQMRPGKQARG